jgi:LysR family nitrogen assimilation transcriptional regulator
LLHHARLGLREFARGREAVEQFKTWGARRLRVGAPASINQRFLPFILVDLRRQHPRLMLTVKTIAPALEPERILHGELDFVLCEAPPANPNLDFTPLFQSPLQIIVPSAHRWLAGQPIPPDELCREPFLLPERQSSSRGLIERHCAREKISLNVVAEAQDFETLKELVKAGYRRRRATRAAATRTRIKTDLGPGAWTPPSDGHRRVRLPTRLREVRQKISHLIFCVLDGTVLHYENRERS